MGIRLFAVLALLSGSAAFAQDYGPQPCVEGYVWREAFDGDYVCVYPTTRDQAALDNRMAARRREPNGGAYGPDTCRAGYVWREAQTGDTVCVLPKTRELTAQDNRMAARRQARTATAVDLMTRAVTEAIAGGAVARPGAGARREAAVVEQPVAVLPQPTPPPLPAAPPSQGGSVRRGFDDNGRPFVEETLGDGSIRRQQGNRVTIIKPDGTSEEYRRDVMAAHAPVATPPVLPSDPAEGRGWVIMVNQRLLNMISQLVDSDPGEMRKFSAAEQERVGDDLFLQVEYRTDVLSELTKL